MVGEGRLGRYRLAIDPHHAPVVAVTGAVLPGTEPHLAQAANRFGGNAPAARLRPVDPWQILNPCPAQPTPGGQQTDRFQQIGLAGTIIAGQHNSKSRRCRIKFQHQPLIIAILG